jgi:APA family basic amino acid/polyamine antiporter
MTPRPPDVLDPRVPPPPPHPPHPSRGTLLRVLGVAFGLAVIIGNTIGSGILRVPGDVAARLPTLTLYFAAWIAGALYAFLGANAVVELATMLPRSGGQYNYARHALGPYAGFVVGWNDWISTAGSVSAVAIVLVESVAVLVPSLKGQILPAALLTIVVFTLLLWPGSRESARLQIVTSALKALAFVVLIGACLAYLVQHGVAHAAPSVDAAAAPGASGAAGLTGTALVAAFVIAMQGIIFTYDGWTGAIYFSEEVRDPGREIPRATFRGILAVAAIYLAVNVAFVLVVPLTSIAGAPLAAGVVAQQIFGDRGDVVIRIIVAVGLLSSINALLPMATRVLFTMSRDGLAPRVAQHVNAGGTPWVALLLSAVVAALFLLSGTFDRVIAVLTFFFVATYAISFASVFVLRHREPNTPRPYRAWGHPWTTGLALFGSLAFLVGTILSDPGSGKWAGGLVVLSVPAYWVTKVLVRPAPSW